MFFGILFSAFSCAEDELPNPTYGGDSLLNFDKSTASSETVVTGQADKIVDISFGTIKAVSNNAQVKLVLDTQNSTAVEGVDFVVVQNPLDLAAGQNTANFKVKIIEASATVIPKVAVFKLQSSSIGNAVFNQSYTLSMSLTCPPSTFVGNFQYTTGFWQDPNSSWVIQEVAGQANTMKIVDFLDPGNDLVFKYNDAGVVTFDTVDTGYIYGTYGMVKIRMSTDATKVSTIDFCSRKLTIYANYFVTAGQLTMNGSPHIKEEFTGL